MRRLIESLLGLSLILVSCSFPQLTANPPPTEFTADAMKTPGDDRSIFRDGLVASEQSVLDKLAGASIYHLELKIADDLYHISGSEEVRYTNQEDVPLSEAQFRLFPNILGGEMTVSNINVDDKDVIPEYRLENSLLILPFSASLEPGQSVVIKMDFAVRVPQDPKLHYGVIVYSDDVLALAHAYPMIGVYDDEGWHAEIPSPEGDVTYADASFYIVNITAPKKLTLVASGSAISHTEAGQSQVLTVADGPARDFFLVASPIYEEISQAVGDVTIHSFAPKESNDDRQLALEVAGRAIKDYGAHYAPYPYTELDIVSTPMLALGIEYPGMIAITSRIYDADANHSNAEASLIMESTVAHEVGHQWFYNLVGNDQLDHPWLDESLTQFATLQYFTDEYGARGADGFRAALERRWESIDRAKIPISLPVVAYEDGSYTPIVYGRGPLFFVALKEEMGAEAFDRFLSEYTRTLSWKIATPEVMQLLAEKNCACELDSIFNQWVYP